MNKHLKYDVIIVGGGLAGLTNAIILSKAKVRVLVIEKKTYPFHKVCGEYVSNEVKPFLQKLGVNFTKLDTAEINNLRISAPNGKSIHAKLDTGGFGISRYKLDYHLYKLALKEGAEILLNSRVEKISFKEDKFNVIINNDHTFEAKLVIGSYGKRDLLDNYLKRSFAGGRTGYMAVKYHVKTDYPRDEVGLYNFKDGYCGISKIEDDLYCLCYLTKRGNMKHFKTIPEMEEKILFKNPWIKWIFRQSTFLFEKPYVINEISFAPKKLVENHILMCGDSAGLITPLCGNGMSMAIHGAKILCDTIINLQVLKKDTIHLTARMMLENQYQKAWKHQFHQRLYTGRIIQNIFGSPALNGTMLNASRLIPQVKNWVIGKTHSTVTI